jgi:antitoxin ParD1/3/4
VSNAIAGFRFVVRFFFLTSFSPSGENLVPKPRLRLARERYIPFLENSAKKDICIPKIGIFDFLNIKVMAKNTSILLGDHFESFISDEISSGRFSSASEVVRTALRLLELEEQKIKKFREEIEIGEKSGMVSNFDPEAHLANLHKKHL